MRRVAITDEKTIHREFLISDIIDGD